MENQIKELIERANKLGIGINDYDYNSTKYPRRDFEKLYYDSINIYEKLTKKKVPCGANMIYGSYDGDGYGEAMNYIDELKKLIKK